MSAVPLPRLDSATGQVPIQLAEGLDSLEAGLALLNDVNEVVFCNRAWVEWHRETIGADLGCGTKTLATLAAATRPGQEWIAHYRRHLRAADSSWLVLSWRAGRRARARFVAQQDGSVLAVIADSTVQYQRECALRESAQRFRSFAAREPFRECEVRMRGDDGEERGNALSGNPFVGEDGSFRGYRATTRNVTQAHKLARRLTYQSLYGDLDWSY